MTLIQLKMCIRDSYRIANEAYEAYYRKRSIGNRLYEEQPNIPEELRDVVYYKRVKFVDVDKLYDIDSPEDFIRFATCLLYTSRCV